MNKKARKIVNRNGGCECDVCEKENILQSHHINGRDIPNPHHKSNIANVCPNCHMDAHYGKVIIEKWVMTSAGHKLFWHKEGEESFTGEDSTPKLLVRPHSP